MLHPGDSSYSIYLYGEQLGLADSVCSGWGSVPLGAGQAEGELMRGMHFRARAPLRIGLAGGGTDVDPYATEKGGVVFNTTINKFAYCTVVPTDDHAMSVHSSEYGDSRVDLGSGPLPLDGNTSLANVVANHFDIKDGFSMTLESEAPPGSGLGGSSQLMSTPSMSL